MKASLIQTYHLNNKLFDLEDSNVNRDNYVYFYYMLKKVFEKRGVNLSTCDINLPNESDIILYHGLQQKFVDYGYDKSYLLALESPFVDKDAFDKKFHTYFKKIFTWSDDLVDNKKFFKVNYSFELPSTIEKKLEGKKLCCTIAGNKFARHKDELYSKRVDLIKWFEKYHLNDFDLYGTSWDNRKFNTKSVKKIFNKSKFLKENFGPKFLSYKGKVESKKKTLSNYKFTICYENIKNQSGYITEKIFDCFFAGSVPVYWGADNIEKYIPSNCFIDMRNFNNYEELYNFMIKMSENDYFKYLDSIEEYLKSNLCKQFDALTFANTIVDEILKEKGL